jgi:hypothetical protein
MAAYLKKYVDRVHDVPPQLQRLFKLIRDLDERVVTLQAAAEEKCRQSLLNTGASKKQRAKTEAALREEVNADMQKMLSLTEEKVRVLCVWWWGEAAGWRDGGAKGRERRDRRLCSKRPRWRRQTDEAGGGRAGGLPRLRGPGRGGLRGARRGAEAV